MEADPSVPYRLALRGGVTAHIVASGSPVTPSCRKAQALLAYLALHDGQAQPRDKLAALLWSESPARRARHSLRQALLEARRFALRLTAAEQDRWLVDPSVRRALVFTMLGRFRDVRDLLMPLQECVDRLADPALSGAYWFRLAMTAGYLGDRGEAGAFALAALDAARASGDEVLQGQAHYVFGLASYYRGRPISARDRQEGRLPLLDRLGRTGPGSDGGCRGSPRRGRRATRARAP